MSPMPLPSWHTPDSLPIRYTVMVPRPGSTIGVGVSCAHHTSTTVLIANVPDALSLHEPVGSPPREEQSVIAGGVLPPPPPMPLPPPLIPPALVPAVVVPP